MNVWASAKTWVGNTKNISRSFRSQKIVIMQAEIEKFVVKAAKQGLEQGNTKRDRENCDPDASLAKTAKVSKAAQSTGPFLLSEDGLTRCSVREFNGKTYVDVRNHFQVVQRILFS